MTARVETDQVKEIIPTDIADDVLESSFIDTAHTLVDAQLLGKGLSDVILTKLELYLAAHFVALTEEKGGIIKDAYGNSNVGFADIYSAGFGSTRFGQAALALDSTGTLQSLTTQKLRAQIRLESELQDF